MASRGGQEGVHSAAYNGELKTLKALLQAEQYNMVDIDRLMSLA